MFCICLFSVFFIFLLIVHLFLISFINILELCLDFGDLKISLSEFDEKNMEKFGPGAYY